MKIGEELGGHQAGGGRSAGRWDGCWNTIHSIMCNCGNVESCIKQCMPRAETLAGSSRLYSVYAVHIVYTTPCMQHSMYAILHICSVLCAQNLVYAALGVCTTQSRKYSVYAVLSVCSTRFMLYFGYAVLGIFSI